MPGEVRHSLHHFLLPENKKGARAFARTPFFASSAWTKEFQKSYFQSVLNLPVYQTLAILPCPASF
jgi:hypothetical protein